MVVTEARALAVRDGGWFANSTSIMLEDGLHTPHHSCFSLWFFDKC